MGQKEKSRTLCRNLHNKSKNSCHAPPCLPGVGHPRLWTCHVPSCPLLTTFLGQRTPSPHGRSLVSFTTWPSDSRIPVCFSLLPWQPIHGEATCWIFTPRVRVYLWGHDGCQEWVPSVWVVTRAGLGQQWGRKVLAGEKGGTGIKGRGLRLGVGDSQWQPTRAVPGGPIKVMGCNWPETRLSLQWKFMSTPQIVANYQVDWWDFSVEFFNFMGISANL